jgi:hypothetical protein
MTMIEYPSTLSSNPLSPKDVKQVRKKVSITKKDATTLKTKLWEAQRLARVILGREAPEMKSGDILEAIRAYALMKTELEQLRKQSALMKNLLTMTRGSDTTTNNNLKKHDLKKGTKDLPFAPRDDVEEEKEIAIELYHIDVIKKENGEVNTAHNDDDSDLASVTPSVCQSLGVGVIDDLEVRIINWQHRFDKIAETHEQCVKECQEDLEEVFESLSSIEESAMDPSRLKETKEHLQRLVEVVEAFPSKQRTHELKIELRECRIKEQKVKAELSELLEEVNELRSEKKIREQRKAGRRSRKLHSRLLSYKKKILKVFGGQNQTTQEEQVKQSRGNENSSPNKRTDEEASFTPSLPSFVDVKGAFLQSERYTISDLIEREEENIKAKHIDLVVSEPSPCSMDQLAQDDGDDDFLLFDNSSEHSSDGGKSACLENQSTNNSCSVELQPESEYESNTADFEISSKWIFKKHNSPSKSMGSSETKHTVSDSLSENEEMKLQVSSDSICEQRMNKGLMRRARHLVGI